MRKIQWMLGWGKLRSTKVVADDALDVADGTGVDMLADENIDIGVRKADAGGLGTLGWWPSRGVNEGRVVSKSAE